MINTKQDFIKKTHLIISVLIVVPVAFSYAFFPDFSFELFPKTPDEHNFYKAVMGLYLGFSTLWIFGIFKVNYLKPAIISNIVFMLGLGFGRLLSIAIDGLPTSGYVYGMFLELLLGAYGFLVLFNFKEIQTNNI